MSSKNRTYATALHPTVEAVLGGLYRYKTLAQAKERLASLASHFVLSKEQPAEEDTILMWIKGFALTAEDEKEGYIGQFARITILQTEDGKFTLTAARHDIPLDVHPQKKRVQMRHPNWGHPILRAAKKGRNYASMEEAQEELMALHEEFPEVSIPGVGKLFIIVYGKKEGSKKPIHKVALEIHPDKEGNGFTLHARDNEKGEKKERKMHMRMGMEKPAEGPKGYFSSLEVIRKEQKKRKFASRYKVKTEDGQPADKKDE